MDLTNELGQGMELFNLNNSFTKNTRYVSGTDMINQNMALLLETRVGECLSNPSFGSRLKEITFDNNVEVLRDEVKEEITRAVNQWIPSIELQEIILADDVYDLEGWKVKQPFDVNYWALPVVIHYRVKRTTMEGSFSTNITIPNA